MSPLARRELDVMAVLWSLEAASVAKIRARIQPRVAYTTVLTILQRLEAKGLVRHDKTGRAHQYVATIDRETEGRKVLARIVDKLFGGSAELLMTQLLESEALPREELMRIRRLVEQRLRGRS